MTVCERCGGRVSSWKDEYGDREVACINCGWRASSWTPEQRVYIAKVLERSNRSSRQ